MSFYVPRTDLIYFCCFTEKALHVYIQPAIICLKLSIETLEQGVKYASGVVLVSLLLTLNIFYTLF